MSDSSRLRKLQLTMLAAAVIASIALIFQMVGGTNNSLLAQSPAEAEEAQVRVAAQRLASGRVELAVQVETQGQWQPSVLPETRWLSSRSRVDRWISTTPVSLSSGHEVRISARRLSSGEVELGLQEILDGKRQERQLPNDRLLPADHAASEWWTSSPLVLPARLSEPTHVPLVRDWTSVTPALRYDTAFGGMHGGRNGTVSTSVRTEPTTGGEWATADYAGRLNVACWNGEDFSIMIEGFTALEGDSAAVTLAIDGLELPPQDWNVWTHYEDDEAVNSTVSSPDSRRLFRLLLLHNASELRAEIEGLEGTRTWDISQMFTTEVQGNLEHCANYVVGYVQPPPPPNYVPLVGLNGWSGDVHYSSNLEENGTVSSRAITEPTSDGEHGSAGYAGALNIHCNDGQHLGVQIESLPPQTAEEFSVTLTIDGEELPTQTWGVGTHYWSDDEGISWTWPPDHRYLYGLLRNAKELSAEIKELDGTRSWDLSRTFTTPAQANLEECGNYVEGVSREPVYDYVPLTNSRGREAGGLEWFARTEDDGGISTYAIRTISVDDSAEQLRLNLGCWSGGGIDVKLNGVPTPTDGTVSAVVTLRIDDGEVFTQTWDLHVYGESATVFAARDAQLYERLRGASSLTIEVADSSLPATTFDLTGMFSTPVQDNIDNCGMYKSGETREIEYDYVPLTGRGRSAVNVSYTAFVQEEGVVGVSSYVDQQVPMEAARDGEVIFRIGCWAAGSRGVNLENLPATEASEAAIMLQIDDQEAVSKTWYSYSHQHAEGWGGLSARQPEELIEQLRGATTLVITIVDSGLTPITINVPTMFETPIQDNIDNCGRYKAGETRELEQPESSVITGRIDDPDGEWVIDWNLSPSGGTVPNTWTRQFVFNTELEVYLVASCSPTGATFIFGGTRFGDLSDDQVEVVWSVDGGAEQLETWQVVDYFGSRYAHPDSALALISSWRNASTLEITLASAPDHTHQLNLTDLFGSPIQAAFDDCLALPRPTLPTPAGTVEQTTVDQLTYGSDTTFGSAVTATSLSLQVPSDSAPEWAGYSSRFALGCGMGGYWIAIWGLGLDTPLFISGESVTVTWSVDDGPLTTAEWDVWPWSIDAYAISPPEDAEFYAAIRNADSLTIDVMADVIFTQTYDLAGNGFWTTPVQPNLDACVGS